MQKRGCLKWMQIVMSDSMYINFFAIVVHEDDRWMT